jgi:hypothetical protein
MDDFGYLDFLQFAAAQWAEMPSPLHEQWPVPYSFDIMYLHLFFPSCNDFSRHLPDLLSSPVHPFHRIIKYIVSQESIRRQYTPDTRCSFPV